MGTMLPAPIPDLILDAPSAEDAERVREWRLQSREAFRSVALPTPLTQSQFYRDLVSDPRGPHRYFAVRWKEPQEFGRDAVAFAGLTHIQWENGTAEISLVVSPVVRGKGIGHETVRLILVEAFDRLRLETVTGEVYGCNALGLAFWRDVAEQWQAEMRTLPRRKFWDGRFWDSLWFSIPRGSLRP